MVTNRLPKPPPATSEPAPAPDATAEAPTDGELLMRFARHDDRDAFARVVERHREMVWGVCSRVLTRHADAEDAYQATLLILAKKAGTIRANDSAGGWLFRVAHNAALESRRRRLARCETPLTEAPPAPEPRFPDIQQKQLVAALFDELRSLPKTYQTVLVLRYLEGKSRRQIAASLEVTVATVAGRLVRGRRMLRSRLARRGVSLAAALGAFGVGTAGAAAGTVHGLASALDPTTLATDVSSTTSAAVQQLVHQGVRTMFLASLTKPAAVGLAAALVAAVLLVDPQDSAAQPAAQGLALEAAITTALEAPGVLEPSGTLLAQIQPPGAQTNSPFATNPGESKNAEVRRQAVPSNRARDAKPAPPSPPSAPSPPSPPTPSDAATAEQLRQLYQQREKLERQIRRAEAMRHQLAATPGAEATPGDKAMSRLRAAGNGTLLPGAAPIRDARGMSTGRAVYTNDRFSSTPAMPAKPKSGPLEAGERVKIEVYDRLAETYLLESTVVIDSEGSLPLGARWGRLEAAGLSLREIEKALKDRVLDTTAKTAQLRAQVEGVPVADNLGTDLGVQVTRSRPETVDLRPLYTPAIAPTKR